MDTRQEGDGLRCGNRRAEHRALLSIHSFGKNTCEGSMLD